MSFFQGFQTKQKNKKETQSNEWLCELFRSGLIDTILEEYIAYCTRPDTQEKKQSKKATGRFPNLAGFCRYLKIGTDGITELSEKYPDAYGRILAVLEDEALNSELSTTLLGSYMKKRLNYERSEHEPSDSGAEISVCFEHDIMKDGE